MRSRTIWLLLAIAGLVVAGVAFAGCMTTEEVEDTVTPQTGASAAGASATDPLVKPSATPLPASPTGQASATPTAHQIAVTQGDVQRDADGKYFVPDRGDGCVYQEVSRNTNSAGELMVGLQAPNCSGPLQNVFVFLPDTGEVRAVPLPTAPPPGFAPLMPTPALRPQPEDARLTADGKYSIPDKGDGCSWQEAGRDTIDGQTWVVLESPQCRGQFWFVPATGQTRLDLHPTPLPTPTAATGAAPARPLEKPAPSDIAIGPDGKYYVPDRGDGCAWTERERFSQADATISGRAGALQVILVTTCQPGLALWYFPETGKVTFVVS